MSLLVALLQVAGATQILLAASHVFFVRPLDWREEIGRLSPVNRAIFWVHTYFIMLVLVLMGVLALRFAPLLIAVDPLAQIVSAGHVIFWGCRLIVQYTLYSPSLWRGNPFRTVIHVLLTIVWIYLTAVYSAAFIAASGRL